MDQHARDFWRIRARKQKEQVNENPVFHEYTALTQYMEWHSNTGVRLPCFKRGTPACLASQNESFTKVGH